MNVITGKIDNGMEYIKQQSNNTVLTTTGAGVADRRRGNWAGLQTGTINIIYNAGLMN